MDLTTEEEVDWIARGRNDESVELKADWTRETGPKGATRWVNDQGDVRYRKPAGAKPAEGDEPAEGSTPASDVAEGDRLVIEGEEAEVDRVSDMGGGLFIAGRTDEGEVVTARVGPDHAFDGPSDDAERTDLSDVAGDELFNAAEEQLGEEAATEALMNADAQTEAFREELEALGLEPPEVPGGLDGLSPGDTVPTTDGWDIEVSEVRSDGVMAADGYVYPEENLELGDDEPEPDAEEPIDDGTGPDWDSLPDKVPVRPNEVTEQWTENNSEALESEAAHHGMSVDEYREELASEYSRVIESSDAAIRVPSSLLSMVVEDGRFKNQHETGTSSGWLDRDRRRNFEQNYFGVKEGTDDGDMPIYGYATSGDSALGDEPEDLAHYGDASVRLTDEAKQRATVGLGDSLSGNLRGSDVNTKFAPTPAADPDEKALEVGNIPIGHDADTSLGMLRNANDATDITMYNEMQYHGGVSVDDFEEVVLSQEPPDGLIDRLDERGIDWRVDP